MVATYNDDALLQMFTLISTFVQYNDVGYNIDII